jgi:ribosomal protein S27E
MIIRRDPTESSTPIDQIVDLHDDSAATSEPAIEVRCPACGNLAFRYPRVLAEDKPVICAGCGAFIASYGELRRRFGERD